MKTNISLFAKLMSHFWGVFAFFGVFPGGFGSFLPEVLPSHFEVREFRESRFFGTVSFRGQTTPRKRTAETIRYLFERGSDTPTRTSGAVALRLRARLNPASDLAENTR